MSEDQMEEFRQSLQVIPDHPESEPPVRSSEFVPPHAPATSEDAKRKIVDLWLSGETNDARLILEAFKIGLDEGRRVRGNDRAKP